jgi:aldehyde dehydrogenase (NAD+)
MVQKTTRQAALPIGGTWSRTRVRDNADNGQPFINNEFREASSGGRFEVANPADESVLGSAAEATLADVTDAVGAARAAFDANTWAWDTEFRKHYLRQLQEGPRKEADAFKSMHVAEAGISVNMLGRIDATIEEMSFRSI